MQRKRAANRWVLVAILVEPTLAEGALHLIHDFLNSSCSSQTWPIKTIIPLLSQFVSFEHGHRVYIGTLSMPSIIVRSDRFFFNAPDKPCTDLFLIFWAKQGPLTSLSVTKVRDVVNQTRVD